MIGMLDHEMDIERQSRELANNRDDSRAEGNVIDEMPVHDIDVEHFDPSFFNAPNVFTTYGAAPPIGWPVFVSMTFETTHCHCALRNPPTQHVNPKSNS